MIHLTGELDTVADNGFVTDVAKVRGAATASSVAAANLKLDGIEEGAIAATAVTAIANARAAAAVGAIPPATTLVNGLATTTQITKLDGIPTDAQSALQVSAIASNVATGLFSTEAVLAWYLANWAVTDWYLDSVAGNDDNDGITAGTALATAEELSRRLAIALPIAHPVTVHVAQGTYGTLAVSVIQTAVACPFDVVGAPLLTSIGTVTYTDRIVASNQASHLVASGVSDWTAHVGKMVVVTDGASVGAVAWIAKASPGGVGASTARVSRFASEATGSSVLPVSKTPATGSAVSIATLPLLESIIIHAVNTANKALTTNVTNRTSRISFVQCSQVYTEGYGYLFVDACRFESISGPLYALSDRQIVGRSLFTGSISSNAAYCRSSLYYCLVGLVSNRFYFLPGSNLVFSLAQNSRAFVEGCSVTDLGIFDCPTQDGLNVNNADSRKSTCGSIYGSGNARCGIAIPAGGSVEGASTCYVTGVSGDIYVTPRAAAIPWSALPYLDGEQSGESTLVAGTVDVTVRTMPIATQKMQVCAKTFAGTPGFLSVVYVNATTIRITSSSATDTSVVTWHILPVGDNVVIRS
jgi:hypothetical protein